MRKEKIKNRELQRLLAMKSGKMDFEEVTEEDFDKIHDIALSAYLMNGKESNIDLNVLTFFPYLKRVKISGFEVSNKIIELFHKMEELTSIGIVKCKFKDVDFSKLNGKIERIKFINCESLPFDYPEVEDVEIVGSTVDFKRINFENVQSVFIQNSIVQNAFDLNKYGHIKKVNLDGTVLYDEDNQELQDINVGENRSYTHQKKLYYHDEYRY